MHGHFGQGVAVLVDIELDILSSSLEGPVHADALVVGDPQVLAADHEVDGGLDVLDVGSWG